MPEVVGVIPARLASSRLPRKLLLAETGKPLIVHTIEQAQKSHLLDEVIVATGDPEIAEVCKKHCRVILTKGDHKTGTDRMAETMAHLPKTEMFVNIQGDEPEIPPEYIDKLVESHHAGDSMASTLGVIINGNANSLNQSTVKIATDGGNMAVYFSRASMQSATHVHIGVYAWWGGWLRMFAGTPRTKPERLEDLEQLRLVRHGLVYKVVTVDEYHKGIDVAEDYRQFVCRSKANRDTQTS